ncbi:MAG: hypothetical protein HQ512_08925 [Rhodospirillales bacterium]|nr:hypothetical protein [Rhodospirillales bacterium]
MAEKSPEDYVYLPEVLFEFRQVGNSVRVTAIDPITSIEITMVAPSRGSQEDVKKIAARRLAYVIAKKMANDYKSDN